MGRISRDDAIVAGLLEWGGDTLRDLPWRRTRDPWTILVSEVMLQQTQVSRVLEKFPGFMRRFPTAEAMAAADLGEALTLWSGLGYPRRCRNLHAASRSIMADHGGRVPTTLDELLALPGVGRYTARAVLCFAHDQHVAVVDTNVARVLSRLDGTAMTASRLQERADSLVPSGASWEWNQIMMDFGARQCHARAPRCAGCPVRARCRWKGSGPDPALTTAGTSRPQSRFEGSDRQARGRAMRLVTTTEASMSEVIAAMEMEHDPVRARAVIESLIVEGLLSRRGELIGLP